ncbi:hypothetical protein DMENIID0001_078870 [Sergentomyia squamirostris]
MVVSINRNTNRLNTNVIPMVTIVEKPDHADTSWPALVPLFKSIYYMNQVTEFSAKKVLHYDDVSRSMYKLNSLPCSDISPPEHSHLNGRSIV